MAAGTPERTDNPPVLQDTRETDGGRQIDEVRAECAHFFPDTPEKSRHDNELMKTHLADFCNALRCGKIDVAGIKGRIHSLAFPDAKAHCRGSVDGRRQMQDKKHARFHRERNTCPANVSKQTGNLLSLR